MSVLGSLLDRLQSTRSIGIMGVVNVTPDSFSDGGLCCEPGAAKRHIDQLLDDGADILDLGAESTRPGAEPVSAAVQIARLGPALLHAARERRALVSVDTSEPEVARFALDHGATIVNDVSCLANIELAREVSAGGGSLLIMHTRGLMRDMAGYSTMADTAYGDVVADVRREWETARTRALGAGLTRDRILFDPGLGFMKNAAHSLELVRRLDEFSSLGHVVVVGPSRKSFLAKTAPSFQTNVEPAPQRRLGATIAACLACVERGASILRVHDVFDVRQALCIQRALGRVG